MKAEPKATGGDRTGRKSIGGVRKTPPNPTVTLAEAGIDKNLAKRARKLAALPEEAFEKKLTERRERVEAGEERISVDLLKPVIRGTQGTGENEWYTPAEYGTRLAPKFFGCRQKCERLVNLHAASPP